MRHFLPELIALPLLPVLIAQGKRTRRLTPRLPEAAGPDAGICGHVYSGKALSLIALGESPVAGVGVATHEEAITGQLAQALAAHFHRPVTWRACGRNGATVREALMQVVPRIPRQPVDIALVAFGVNDTTAFHTAARWRNELRAVLTALEASCEPHLILLSGVPPIAHFPALPQPLRWVMGLKSRSLDMTAKALALGVPRTIYVPLTLDTSDVSMMACDGYHPSVKGCAAWAELLADACFSALRHTH